MENQGRRATAAFIAWSCVTIFYCYQYVLRAIPTVIMPDLMARFDVNAVEFGSYAGIYYIGYILVHIPIGVMLTRFGSRSVMAVCVLLSAIGLAPVVYSNNWDMVYLGRFLTGLGSSASAVGSLQIFRILYPKTFARMIGIMVSSGLITVFVVNSYLAQFIEFIGFDETINILTIIGVVLAVLTYILMPKSTDEAHSGSLWQDIKEVVTNYKIILLSFFGGLMVGPLEGFADAWGSAFLIQVYSIDKSLADSTVLYVFQGMCVGGLIIPYLAERYGSYYGTTIISGLAMFACFAYLLSEGAQTSYIGYVCIIIGVFSAYQVVVIAKTVTLVKEEQSGMAGSIANMIIMAFGWVFHNSIGYTLEKQWRGTIVDGVKVYGNVEFVNSLIIIPAAIALATVGIVIIALTEYKNKSPK